MRLLLLTTPLRNQTGVENYAFYMKIFSLHVIEKLVAERNTVNILCVCVCIEGRSGFLFWVCILKRRLRDDAIIVFRILTYRLNEERLIVISN